MTIITRDSHQPTPRERLDAWPHGTYRQIHDVECNSGRDPAQLFPYADPSSLPCRVGTSRDGGSSP